MIRKHRKKASLTPVLFIQGLGKAPGFTYWHVWMHKNKMFGETEIQGNGYIHINTDTAANTGGVGLLNIQSLISNVRPDFKCTCSSVWLTSLDHTKGKYNSAVTKHSLLT